MSTKLHLMTDRIRTLRHLTILTAPITHSTISRHLAASRKGAPPPDPRAFPKPPPELDPHAHHPPFDVPTSRAPVGKGMDPGDEVDFLKPEKTDDEAMTKESVGWMGGDGGMDGGGTAPRRNTQGGLGVKKMETDVDGVENDEEQAPNGFPVSTLDLTCDFDFGPVGTSRGIEKLVKHPLHDDVELRVLRVTDDQGRAGYVPLETAGLVVAEPDVRVVRTLEGGGGDVEVGVEEVLVEEERNMHKWELEGHRPVERKDYEAEGRHRDGLTGMGDTMHTGP